VKAVSELFAPMSGEITEVNPVLRDHPESVNKDPHTTWIARMRLSNPSEASSLLDTAAYERRLA
jgi:glycine cleavage system H protein